MERIRNLQSSAKTTTIGGLKKMFGDLVESTLPEVPHLLTIPGAPRDHYGQRFEQELRDIPWNLPMENKEARKLQYMTLFSEMDREGQVPRGDWQDDIGESPPNSSSMRSSIGTPQISSNKAKMSHAEYIKMKQTGIKPTPRQSTATPDAVRPNGHVRTTSNLSNATPKGRAPSSERPSNGETQKNGTAVQSGSKLEHKGAKTSHEQSNNTSSKPHPPTNGINGHTENSNRQSLKNKEVNTSQKSTKPTSLLPAKEPLKHSLPPRPQTYAPDNKIQKRPLDTEPQSRSEKRAKIDRTSSPGASKIAATKPETHSSSKAKPPPSNLGKSDDHQKASRTSIETKQQKSSKSEKLNLPPLLSPLPDDLLGSTTFDSPKKNDTKATPSNSQSKSKPTTGAKKLPAKVASRESSPFELPPLLSPTLPDIVEQELAKFQGKKRETDKHAADNRQGLLTVEARHKEARRPDAPGVARKTTSGAIIGHPPKKSASSTPQHKPREVSKPETKSLIVKLPYSKRKAQTVERLVRLSPRPSPVFLKLEAVRKKDGIEAMMAHGSEKKVSSDSEEEVPLAARAGKTIAKKRPSEIPAGKSEPPAKRVKGPDNLDVAASQKSSSTALKSPAFSAPPQKNHLVTPKKGDGATATAMRKVDSNDGSVRTPQLTTTASTPASVERPRVNGERPASANNPVLEQAQTLKRKADRLFRAPDAQQRKLGNMIGMESACRYMRTYCGSKFAPNTWEALLPLFNVYMQTSKDFPILQAMFLQLKAIVLEEIVRGFTQYRLTGNQSAEALAQDMQVWSKLQVFSKQRDETWAESNARVDRLKSLRMNCPMLNFGPWNNVRDLTTFAMEVCAAYEKIEKTGWQKEVSF